METGKRAAKLRAVFFDAGGTLFQPHPSVGELYARTAAKHGMKVDPHKVEHIFREEFARRDKLESVEAHRSEKNEREWWHSLVKDVFAQVTEINNFEAYFEDLYDLFARAEAWKLYPEVIGLLEILKAQKLILGIISNWDHRLHSICTEMQLTHYFDFILASAVVGSAKPDSGIFKEALKRADVAPHEAVHVGDSVENDYHGAKNVGIRALLVDRSGRAPKDVETIPSLSGVLAFCKLKPL